MHPHVYGTKTKEHIGIAGVIRETPKRNETALRRNGIKQMHKSKANQCKCTVGSRRGEMRHTLHENSYGTVENCKKKSNPRSRMHKTIIIHRKHKNENET
jgi:hypothetical protein